jgi:ADP-ribose pyrophosphatase YjhB (NUDIX family)
VEALYILRATRESDPWSGHVAFPGGRQNPGESDLDTCIRETREELGLELSDESLFSRIGRLDDTGIYFNDRVSFVLGCFIFKVNPAVPVEAIAITPDLREVKDYAWVPLECIIDSSRLVPYELILTSGSLLPIHEHFRRYARLLRIDKLVFPSIILETSRNIFQLWGITLRLTEQVANLPPTVLQHTFPLLRSLEIPMRFPRNFLAHDVLWHVMLKVAGSKHERNHFSYLYRMYFVWFHGILFCGLCTLYEFSGKSLNKCILSKL